MFDLVVITTPVQAQTNTNGVPPPLPTSKGSAVSPEVIRPSFPAALQQFSDFPKNTAQTVQSYKFWGAAQAQLPPQLLTPVLPQRWDYFEPRELFKIYLDGWRGLQFDYRFAQPFPVVEQKWEAFEPRGAIGIFPDGWRGLQLDSLIAALFPVTEQKWEAFAPRGAIGIFPEGWRGVQLESAFAKPLPVTEQIFYVPPERHVPIPVDVEGWFGAQLDYRFAKPFPITEQPLTPVQIAEPFPPPNGWWGLQLNTRFTAPLPPTQQQWSGFEPAGFIRTSEPYGWWGNYEFRFASPFPPPAQQWDAWPAQIVPIFYPPGAGKRRDFPSYIPQPPYDERPRKPIKPVWDRPKGPVVPPPVARPAGPPALPPLEIFRGPPRIISAGLPTFAQYAPPDPLALGRALGGARDQADASAAVRALSAAQQSQQQDIDRDTEDAIAALKALGLLRGN